MEGLTDEGAPMAEAEILAQLKKMGNEGKHECSKTTMLMNLVMATWAIQATKYHSPQTTSKK